MRKFGSQARAAFDRIFPERHIYVRSCGAVRGFRISPGCQVLAALCAVGVVGWCGYATGNVLGEGQRRIAQITGIVREHAKYARWLNETRAQAGEVHSLMEQRVHLLDRMTQRLENRHDVLRQLLEYAGGASLRAAGAAETDGLQFLTHPTDDNVADVRPSESRATVVSLNMVGAENSLPPEQGDQSAADSEASGVEQPDFVEYMRDPNLSNQVAQAADRLAYARSFQE